MLRFLLLSICIVYCISFTYSQGNPSLCTYTDPATNFTYDLSAMALPVTDNLTSFYDYNDTTSSAGNYFVSNICAPVNVTLFPGMDNNTAVLQIDFSNSNYSCGLVTNSSFSAYGGEPSTYGQGVRVYYGNGTFCGGASVARSTIIDIGCDLTQQGHISNVSEPSPCSYHIQMWAMSACATNYSPTSSPSHMPSVNTTCPSPVPPVNTTCPSPVPPVNTTCPSPVPPVNTTCPSPVPPVNTTCPTPVNTTCPTPLPTMTNVTIPSLTNSTTPSLTNSTAASKTSTSSSGIPSWVWWVLASVLVLILIIAACIAGFVIWKKKQQQNYDFDPIDYE